MGEQANNRKLSREEVAKREIGHTAVRPGVAWALIVLFVATVFAVPVAQHVHEIRSAFAAEADLTWDRPAGYLPRCYDIVYSLPRAWRVLTGRARAGGAGPDAPVFRRFQAANDRVLLRDIHRHTDALKDESLLCDALLPPAQRAMAACLGVGNEQAYLGRGGWLFYRPGVDYVTGPGFLSARHVRRRRDDVKEWQDPVAVDPVGAIVDFALQLRRRGIRLVLLPAPAKTMLHPEKLSRRFDDCRDVVRNPSFEAFRRRLREAFAAALTKEPAAPGPAGDIREIHLYDPAPELLRLKFSEDPPRELYLHTDTHWRPEAMDFVAERLAGTLRRRLAEAGAPDAPAARHLEQAVEVTAVGDVAAMVQPLVKSPLFGGAHRAIGGAFEALHLAAAARIWRTDRRGVLPAETVTVCRVLDALGSPWTPDRAADVLLLGDSFSNVYSSGEMGWGDSGGLAERLSFHLRRDVDAIVRNDAGSFATRRLLADELRAGRDRLAGKRVVVWQFAIRELAVGDWRRIELKLGRARTRPATTASRPAGVTDVLELAPGRSAVVSGRIAALKVSPRPGTVPYRNHIMPVHLVDARCAELGVRGGEAVVLLWGLRNNQATHATRLRVGQEITVRLRPWGDVAGRYGTINTDDLDEVDFDVSRLWCEELR